MTTISEQQRGEDGRFVAQPSPGIDPAAPAPADASAGRPPAEKAPAREAAASDPYEDAAIEVTGKRPSDLTSGTVVPERQDDGARAQPDTSAGPAQSPPPSPPSAAADAAPPDDAARAFDGMSAKTHALLKSVPGGLVTPDEWRAMDVTERVDHVNRVVEFRNGEKRKYNERQAQGQARPAPARQPQSTELGQPPPPAQGARVPAAAGVTLSEADRATLAAMAEQTGEDHPVYKAYAAQAERMARLESQLAERDQQSQAREQSQAAERQARTAEDQVFDQLEAKYPALASPAQRDRLRQTCRDWYGIEYGRDPTVNGFAVIERTVHRELFQQTQEAQSKRDADASKTLRAGSFGRGAPSAPARSSRPAGGGDPYAEVNEHLAAAHGEGMIGDAAVERAVRRASSKR